MLRSPWDTRGVDKAPTMACCKISPASYLSSPPSPVVAQVQYLRTVEPAEPQVGQISEALSSSFPSLGPFSLFFFAGSWNCLQEPNKIKKEKDQKWTFDDEGEKRHTTKNNNKLKKKEL